MKAKWMEFSAAGLYSPRPGAPERASAYSEAQPGKRRMRAAGHLRLHARRSRPTSPGPYGECALTKLNRLLFITLLAMSCAVARAQPTFQSLGPHTNATGVSADGSVVVGTWYYDPYPHYGEQAFRWTEQTGRVGLLGPDFVTTIGSSISSDGSVVVGWGENRSGNYEAFRWTGSDGILGLEQFTLECIRMT